LSDIIFERCKCASRLKPFFQEGFVDFLLDNSEKAEDEEIPYCRNLRKWYEEQAVNSIELSKTDPCQGCPIYKIIFDPDVKLQKTFKYAKEFKPLNLIPRHTTGLPKAPKFPLDLIPKPFNEYIQKVADSLDCPVDYPAMAMLVAWSGVVGLKQELIVKPKYIETACIWAAIVGSPSTKKTPSMKLCTDFLNDIEAKEWDRFQREMANYEDLEKLNQAKGEKKPVLKTLIVGDATREKASELMRDNPDGLICIYDELSFWINALDAYKTRGGTDSKFWLSVWSSALLKVQRKMGSSYTLKRPFFSLLGNLLPEYLKKLYDSSSGFIGDGMCARFLFVYPDHKSPVFDFDTYVDQDLYDKVGGCFNWMYNTCIEKYEKNYNCDGYIMLDRNSNAKKLFAEWVNGMHKDQVDSDALSEDLKVHWGKLPGYVCRIALLFHTMCEARDKKVNRFLLGSNMERAIKIVEYYFKPHIRRAYHYRGLTKDDKMKNRLYDWLVRKTKDSGDPLFTKSDINQNWRPNTGKTVPANTIKEYCITLEAEGKGINLAGKYFYVFNEK